MKIRTNSPTVLDLVIRILSQSGMALKKAPQGNEVMVTNDDISEGKLRLILQEKLDENKFNFEDDFVLVDGNSVWSYNAIIKEINKIKKADSTSGITGYFYKFMHLNFTIAQGNMRDWMVEYPSFDKVINLLGQGNVPDWKADVNKILQEIKKNENVTHD